MSDPPPETMRAMVLTGHGGLERLVPMQVPTPRPGPGEVLVRLGGAAVNNTDINLRIGWYSKSVSAATDETVTAVTGTVDAGWAGDPLTFPRIQGADGAGRIVSVGRGVAPARVGERVLIDPIIRIAPNPQYFGSDVPGSFAEYTCVPTANAVRIESTLSDLELASFPCSYLAALHMVSRAHIITNQNVLITGASGGVGTAAVQWCVARGANVVAVAESTKTEALLALGAKHVISRQKKLCETYGKDFFDAVIDVVGGTVFPELLAVLKPHGHYATAGAIAGPIVELDLRTLYLKDLTLHGCTIPPESLMMELVSAIEHSLIKPVIAQSYHLQDLALAQADFLRKKHVGKIVLKIS